MLVSVALLSSTLIQPATAAMIGTSEVLGIPGSTASEHGLLRDQVASVLMRRGVEHDAAWQRVNALSHTELQLIQQKIDQLPAGQSAFAVLGVVFLVLLVLELVGAINIFNRI